VSPASLPARGLPRTALRACALPFAGALLAACGSDAPAPARDPAGYDLPAPQRPVTLTGPSRTFVDSLRSTEARRIEQTDGRLRRVSIDRLWLLPSEAEPVAFDDVIDGEIMLLHVFRSRMPPGYAIIEMIRMEGGSFLLVDERTGARYEIDDMPAISPDGARFATASFDIVAGHVPNRLVIYRITEDGPVEEWTLEPQAWGPSDVEWLDDGMIRFVSNELDTSTQPFTERQVTLEAERTATGWRVVE
jgi:hypothetical protein